MSRGPVSDGLHLVSNRLCQSERAAAILAADQRGALVADGLDEVGQLALQRLLADDGELAPLDLRALPFAALQAVAFHFLLRVVARNVGVGLEEADLPDALLADAA